MPDSRRYEGLSVDDNFMSKTLIFVFFFMAKKTGNRTRFGSKKLKQIKKNGFYPVYFFTRFRKHSTVPSRGYKRRGGSTNPRSHSSLSHQTLTQLPTTRAFSTSQVQIYRPTLATCYIAATDCASSSISLQRSPHPGGPFDKRILSASSVRNFARPHFGKLLSTKLKIECQSSPWQTLGIVQYVHNKMIPQICQGTVQYSPIYRFR